MAVVKFFIDQDPLWIVKAQQALAQKRSVDVIVRGPSASKIAKELAKHLPPAPSSPAGKVYSITVSKVAALASIGYVVVQWPSFSLLILCAAANGYKDALAKYDKKGASLADDEFYIMFRP